LFLEHLKRAGEKRLMEILQTLGQLVLNLRDLIVELLVLVLRWSPLIAWIAWWLGAVNWRKAWRALADGAWAPLLLLIVMASLVWSRLDPGDCFCLVLFTVPNFWWQLGGVALLAAIAFLCGWLQGVFGWTPAEIDLEPPAAAVHAHGHHH
jgi:hypothetical protein